MKLYVPQRLPLWPTKYSDPLIVEFVLFASHLSNHKLSYINICAQRQLQKPMTEIACAVNPKIHINYPKATLSTSILTICKVNDLGVPHRSKDHLRQFKGKKKKKKSRLNSRGREGGGKLTM